jgi:multicomponent K+:H+ antiporter subunit D
VSNHLIIAPIVLPLLVAALQLLVGEKRRRTVLALSVASCVALVLLAAALMQAVSDDGALAAVYRIGDWPARFGIVLVADRLSALMVLLTCVLALAVLPYALGRWQHRGGHFQPLLQFLLMGLNGAFLTGDLFNLFVFFEVLLAASYGLALHGSGARRVSAGLHYIAVNLTASMLFLLGVSLIFGVTGTLNMAALAELIPHVPERTRA